MYFKILFRTVFIASILVTFDRTLKLLAVNYNGFFVIGTMAFGASFGMVKNFGIAFSIKAPLIAVVLFSMFILIYLLWALYSGYRHMPKFQNIIFGLIIAGGLSNIFDRLIYGYVIDYWSIFLFGKSLAFNLADIMIVIGALMLGVRFVRKPSKSQRLSACHEILSLNRAAYNKIAADFSQTREKPLWPELFELKKYIKNRDCILDIGCGSGRLLRLFDDIDVDYIGIDRSQNLLDQARSKWANCNEKVKFWQGDMLRMDFCDNNFDAVFMIASLNHLPACCHHQALSEAFRVLKPGGYLLMTNFNLWRFSIKDKTAWRHKLRFSKDAISHNAAGCKGIITFWNGQPLYYYAFTLREIKRKCQKACFDVKEIYYALDGQRAHFWNGRNIVLIGCKDKFFKTPACLERKLKASPKLSLKSRRLN